METGKKNKPYTLKTHCRQGKWTLDTEGGGGGAIDRETAHCAYKAKEPPPPLQKKKSKINSTKQSKQTTHRRQGKNSEDEVTGYNTYQQRTPKAEKEL